MVILFIGDWRMLAVRGVAAVLFGVAALVWPDLTLWALVVLFGAFVLVDGVMALVAAFTRSQETEGTRALLVLHGLLGIAAGAITFFWPGITALALLYVIAAWAFLIGILRIVGAVRLRKVIDNEWLLGLTGLLWIALGAVLVVTPGTGALAIVWAIGLLALLAGVVELGLAWKVRRIQQAGRGRAPAAPAGVRGASRRR